MWKSLRFDFCLGIWNLVGYYRLHHPDHILFRAVSYWISFSACPAERGAAKGLVSTFLHCLIHPPVDTLGLTFESLQSQQKLQQGNYINKNSTFMLIDSRQHNSSYCK